MMLLASGLDAIDASCEEAAAMDGAGPWRVVWYVTLPLLRPAILPIVLTNMIKGVGYFALMLVLTEGRRAIGIARLAAGRKHHGRWGSIPRAVEADDMDVGKPELVAGE